MERELIHNPIFLAQVSLPATKEDLTVAADLLDTLTAHRDTCVGMAANMIGILKRIICFQDQNGYTTMLNPEIISKSDVFETEEGCLSLLGGPRKTKRYRKIKVKFETLDFKVRYKTYNGFAAQIIQHEVDHINGVLI